MIVLAISAGIWVHLSLSHLASSRYVLSIAVLSTSSAAMGVLGCSNLVAVAFAKRWPARTTYMRTAVASLLVMGIVGWADALSSDLRSRSCAGQPGSLAAHRVRLRRAGERDRKANCHWSATTPTSMPRLSRTQCRPSALADWVACDGARRHGALAAPTDLAGNPGRCSISDALGLHADGQQQDSRRSQALVVLVRSATLETNIRQATRPAVPGSATP